MRALVLHGPSTASVDDVPEPTAGTGEVLVRVRRVGLCGTDIAFHRGTMPYLHTGGAHYPLRIGHEWMGTVDALGDGVEESWLGRRVTGDTMLGCGHCRRCLGGRQHVCADRFEIGVLGGWDGAAGELLRVPVRALQPIPDSVDDLSAALVEPVANGARAVRDAAVQAGQRVAVIGPGTLGLGAAIFARAAGATVDVVGRSGRRSALVELYGAQPKTWDDVGDDYDVVIEASGGAGMPSRATTLVTPGGTIVCVGINAVETPVDTRTLVTNDIRLIGNLSGSPAMASTIAALAHGDADLTPLVDTVAGLEDAPALLDDPSAGKIHLLVP